MSPIEITSTLNEEDLVDKNERTINIEEKKTKTIYNDCIVDIIEQDLEENLI